MAFGVPGEIPIIGDWNGDGVFTIGVFNPNTALWTCATKTTRAPPTPRVHVWPARRHPGLRRLERDRQDRYRRVPAEHGAVAVSRNESSGGPADAGIFMYGLPARRRSLATGKASVTRASGSTTRRRGHGSCGPRSAADRRTRACSPTAAAAPCRSSATGTPRARGHRCLQQACVHVPAAQRGERRRRRCGDFCVRHGRRRPCGGDVGAAGPPAAARLAVPAKAAAPLTDARCRR